MTDKTWVQETRLRCLTKFAWANNEMTLTVTEGNTVALSLYERCGVRIFGTEPLAVATVDGFRAKLHLWTPIGDAAVAVATARGPARDDEAERPVPGPDRDGESRRRR